VVDIDGDIPIEKLLQLQKRLQSKGGTEEFESKTFVNEKNVIKSSNQGRPLFMNVSAKQNSPQQSIQTSVPAAKKPEPKTAVTNNFWGTGQTNAMTASSKAQPKKVDSFDDFFGGSTKAPENPKTQPQSQN
jgi:hypothetical protein